MECLLDFYRNHCAWLRFEKEFLKDVVVDHGKAGLGEHVRSKTSLHRVKSFWGFSGPREPGQDPALKNFAKV